MVLLIKVSPEFRKNRYSPCACFIIHHSLFQKQLYNTEYKIISDWIHTMESIIFNDCSYKYIDIVIAEVDGKCGNAVLRR